MLSKKNTTAKQDATRNNTARGTARTATDAAAEHAATRSRAASTPRKGDHTPTADHLKEGEKSDTAVGPEAGPPLPPPAPIPLASNPETVTADDVATRKALDDAEEESVRRRAKHRGEKAPTAKQAQQAKVKAFNHGEHGRHECLMHCAATILSRSITMSAKDAVAEALAIEDELHKQLDEQQKKAETDDAADGDETK
jgi:hypothetical protein